MPGANPLDIELEAAMVAPRFLRFRFRKLHCPSGQGVQAAVLFACVWLFAGRQTPQLCYGQATVEQESRASAKEAKEEVLRHAVFFKFKDSSAKEDVDRVVEAFRALPSKIKEIREFQSGENVSRSALNDGLTHCFLLSFMDEAGRAAYLPHPDHKAFGATLRPHLGKVFVIDYWGKPQAALLKKELKHAVFFKFKDNTSDDDVKKVEDGLAALPAKINAIKAFEWGRNNSPEKHDEGFTHCFMFTFDSEDGLKEYIDDPAHAAAADDLRPKMERIRVLDFWAEGVRATAKSRQLQSAPGQPTPKLTAATIINFRNRPPATCVYSFK